MLVSNLFCHLKNNIALQLCHFVLALPKPKSMFHLVGYNHVSLLQENLRAGTNKGHDREQTANSPCSWCGDEGEKVVTENIGQAPRRRMGDGQDGSGHDREEGPVSDGENRVGRDGEGG